MSSITFSNPTSSDFWSITLPAAWSVYLSLHQRRRNTRMLSLDDRIALLKEDLLADPPSFIMARELPFAIFRYDPNHAEESEGIIRRKIKLLSTEVGKKNQPRTVPFSL